MYDMFASMSINEKVNYLEISKHISIVSRNHYVLPDRKKIIFEFYFFFYSFFKIFTLSKS